jgi:hypothetical protein
MRKVYKKRRKKEKENNQYTKTRFSRIHKDAKHALVGGSLLTSEIFKRIKREWGTHTSFMQENEYKETLTDNDNTPVSC